MKIQELGAGFKNRGQPLILLGRCRSWFSYRRPIKIIDRATALRSEMAYNAPIKPVLADKMPTNFHRLQHLLSRYRLHDWHAWQERAVIWGYALVVGLLISFYVRLCDLAILFYRQHGQTLGAGVLLLSPLACVLIVYLVRTYFAGSEGSGIPQVIAAFSEQKNEDKTQVRGLVSLSIASGKVLLGALAIAGGLSTGREGPCVQIAASVLRQARRFLPAESRITPSQLMLAGGAAGIAAAFNTPLAGIVFAIEELSRRFEEKTSGVMLTAIILAGMVSTSLLGSGLYFGHMHIDQGSPDPRALLLCALVCGISGGLGARLFIAASHPHSRLQGLKRQHPYLNAGFCGLAIAVLALLSAGAINGSGYDVTHAMLMHGQLLTPLFAVEKFFATWLSFHSGVPGGIFAPTLAVGAGLGRDLQSFTGADANTLYALCMAGFLAAMTQAPITASVIVMEMIDGHQMVISLLAVTLLATLVARAFSPPLYPTLALRYRQAADAAAPVAKSPPAAAEGQVDSLADRHPPE